jgi:hypothetical protein
MTYKVGDPVMTFKCDGCKCDGCKVEVTEDDKSFPYPPEGWEIVTVDVAELGYPEYWLCPKCVTHV